MPSCLQWRGVNSSVKAEIWGNCIPIIYHKPGTPRSRQAPFNSPSLLRSQIGEHLLATSLPHTLRICSLELPYLELSGYRMWLTKNCWKTYPVAYTTTSAGSWLPSSNRRPVSVNDLIWLSFLSFILPSAINWLVPTSNYNRKLVGQAEEKLKSIYTYVVTTGLSPDQHSQSSSTESWIGSKPTLVQCI